MSLNNFEQFKQIVNEKKHILITFKKRADGDAIGAALAIKKVLEQNGKKIDIVCDDFKIEKKYAFLTGIKDIKNALLDLHKFIISIDIKDTGINELSYDIKENNLRIFVSPKKGFLSKEKIKTSQTDFKYDLIIVLDTSELYLLANIYNKNEDFFYTTPIINIDHKSTNEYFGHLNIIDLPASSTSEIIYKLFEKIYPEFLTAEIAEILLTGIIHGTNSFKNKKVNPNTLAIAGKLVDLGADREKIIKNLYQTKDISTFKLWGIILNNLQYDKENDLVWSILTREDFKKTDADRKDLENIIDEIIVTSPEAKYILLLFENENNEIEGKLKILPAHHATEIMKKYNAVGDENDANFIIKNSSIKKAEEEILQHIKNEIKKN
ncbi:MAG: DHH family phosphoesterase [Patescibacteria group bacterium]